MRTRRARGPTSERELSPFRGTDLLRRIEHRAKGGNAIGKHVLSQWWPCDFDIDDVRYGSAEHYMMAGKARMFSDAETARRICKAATPGAAKALGRAVKNFDQAR